MDKLSWTKQHFFEKLLNMLLFIILPFPMKKAAFYLLTLLFIPLAPLDLSAQVHAYPEDGARGIPGQEDRSYVFGWKAVEGASAYEYILTDNPFCFSNFGCPIQTGTTGDTFAIGRELTEDWSYYWITRVIYANGDSSAWSNPSEFIAQDPPQLPLLSTVPNPNFNNEIRVRLNWAASSDLDRVAISVFDSQGKMVLPPQTFLIQNSPFQMQSLLLNKKKLPLGMYFIRAMPTASDGFILQDRWTRAVLR